MPFAFVYLDDILVTTHSPQEHWQHIQQLFTLLSPNGLVINNAKSVFGVAKLDFLSRHVSVEGITLLPDSVASGDRTSLQRFLGMINYHRFPLRIAAILAPLGVPKCLWQSQRISQQSNASVPSSTRRTN